MPELKARSLIFTETQSHTVLLAKRGSFGDSPFQLSGVTMCEFDFPGEELPAGDYRATFEPSRGVSSRPPPESKELARLQLLRKKVETVLLTRSIVHMVRQNFVSYYSPEELTKISLGKEARGQLLRLAASERAILEQRGQKFFCAFQKRVDTCADVKAVENQFRYLQNNVSIGPFSFKERGAADE